MWNTDTPQASPAPRFYYHHDHLWSLFSFEIKWIPQHSALSSLNSPLYKFIVDRFLHKTAATSTAALALVEEERKMAQADRIIQVRVGKYYVWALPSQLQCNILEVASTCSLKDRFTNLWRKVDTVSTAIVETIIDLYKDEYFFQFKGALQQTA